MFVNEDQIGTLTYNQCLLEFRLIIVVEFSWLLKNEREINMCWPMCRDMIYISQSLFVGFGFFVVLVFLFLNERFLHGLSFPCRSRFGFLRCGRNGHSRFIMPRRCDILFVTFTRCTVCCTCIHCEERTHCSSHFSCKDLQVFDVVVVVDSTSVVISWPPLAWLKYFLSWVWCKSFAAAGDDASMRDELRRKSRIKRTSLTDVRCKIIAIDSVQVE